MDYTQKVFVTLKKIQKKSCPLSRGFERLGKEPAK